MVHCRVGVNLLLFVSRILSGFKRIIIIIKKENSQSSAALALWCVNINVRNNELMYFWCNVYFTIEILWKKNVQEYIQESFSCMIPENF